MTKEQEQRKEQLEDVRKWAHGKIAANCEPPWAWYQYMKLIEAIDTILAGAAVTASLEDLPEYEEH